MLARRRDINSGGRKILDTPLLVPSFSSRGFPDVKQILETMREYLTESLLVSAYDIHYGHVDAEFGSASLVVLDSGGYEHSRKPDLSDLGYVGDVPREPWSPDLYLDTLDRWETGPDQVATIVVSYDQPGPRTSFEEQVRRAHEFFGDRTGIVRDLLVKPETDKQEYVQIKHVLESVELLGGFDVVGFTEKELGNSILQRMERIARIRRSMDEAGIATPIHVFGGLDPISTPLYYISGAEVFDGLSWLRLAYRDGVSIYKPNYGALNLGLNVTDTNTDSQCWANNHHALTDLKLEMCAFQVSGGDDFTKFRFNGDLFRRAFDALCGRLGREV